MTQVTIITPTPSGPASGCLFLGLHPRYQPFLHSSCGINRLHFCLNQKEMIKWGYLNKMCINYSISYDHLPDFLSKEREITSSSHLLQLQHHCTCCTGLGSFNSLPESSTWQKCLEHLFVWSMLLVLLCLDLFYQSPSTTTRQEQPLHCASAAPHSSDHSPHLSRPPVSFFHSIISINP